MSTRFRREYQCDDFRREHLGAGGFQFVGCGHRVTYVCVGAANEGTSCVVQSEETYATPLGAAVQLETVMLHGESSLRLRLPSVGVGLEYSPNHARERIAVLPESSDCEGFFLVTPAGRIGSLSGIDLSQLASLPADADVQIAGCGVLTRLSGGDRAEFARFVQFAVRLRDESPATE